VSSPLLVPSPGRRGCPIALPGSIPLPPPPSCSHSSRRAPLRPSLHCGPRVLAGRAVPVAGVLGRAGAPPSLRARPGSLFPSPSPVRRGSPLPLSRSHASSFLPVAAALWAPVLRAPVPVWAAGDPRPCSGPYPLRPALLACLTHRPVRPPTLPTAFAVCSLLSHLCACPPLDPTWGARLRPRPSRWSRCRGHPVLAWDAHQAVLGLLLRSRVVYPFFGPSTIRPSGPRTAIPARPHTTRRVCTPTLLLVSTAAPPSFWTLSHPDLSPHGWPLHVFPLRFSGPPLPGRFWFFLTAVTTHRRWFVLRASSDCARSCVAVLLVVFSLPASFLGH